MVVQLVLKSSSLLLSELQKRSEALVYLYLLSSEGWSPSLRPYSPQGCERPEHCFPSNRSHIAFQHPTMRSNLNEPAIQGPMLDAQRRLKTPACLDKLQFDKSWKIQGSKEKDAMRGTKPEPLIILKAPPAFITDWSTNPAIFESGLELSSHGQNLSLH